MGTQRFCLAAVAILFALVPRPIVDGACASESADGLPAFRYQGVVLGYEGLKYRPHDDVIFPSVIKAYQYFRKPLGRYYLYYAPHTVPGGICLAYANKLEGPWKEYESNPLIGNNWPPHYKVSHVSSPDAVWNAEEHKLFLYYHGENTETRYAISCDGVHFEYGGVAVRSKQFVDGKGGCSSYSRVARYSFPGKDNRWIMMGMAGSHTLDANSKPMLQLVVFLAWSKDGRSWTAQRAPFIVPAGELYKAGVFSSVGSPWYFPWKGKHYIIVLGDLPLYPGVISERQKTNLYVYETDPGFTKTELRGKLLDRRVVGPENDRVDSCCIVKEDGKLYMFMAIGTRLNQKIGLAIADLHPARQ